MLLAGFLFAVIPVLSALDCGAFKTCKSCPDHFDDSGKQLCEWCVSSEECVGTGLFSCLFAHKITRGSDCPIHEKEGFEYSDDFARTKMLPIAAAAYSDSPQDCLMTINAKVKRLITVTPTGSDVDSFSAFAGFSITDKAIILSFKGSNGDQIWSEGYQSVLKNRVPFIGGGKVSEYFDVGFKSLWEGGLKDDFLTFKSRYPGYKLWLTGHSLGGSLASIAAGYIIKTGLFASPNVKLVTFGQPRTGDHDYSAAHDELMSYSYRVVHRHDMVPHLPPKNFEDYYHHRFEAWYNNDMKTTDHVECKEPEGDECSNSSMNKFSVADHQNYFDCQDISSYGNNGCKKIP